jgi:GH25 family lysozyme M1 (1,4-beta-N-acetylmuramidase)
MIPGIDISNHQTTADFAQIKRAGYLFCIHKATEGVGFLDKYLSQRWQQMKAAGVARGCYHFARPSQSTADAEAAYFLQMLERTIMLEPGDSVWLDMEDENFHGNASPWTLRWCALVEEALGFRPGVYTYPYYQIERHLDHPDLAKHPLWWASYEEPMRPCPAPWTGVEVWQYTSDGTVPGTTGRIDLNRYLGENIQGFLALGKPGAVAGPPYATANEAYDAWCREEKQTLAWSGQIVGRSHWFGRDPQEVARTSEEYVIAYNGEMAVDVTGYVVDDWQTLTADQLTIWGREG